MAIEVAELVVYPIKSLRGISLGASAVEKRGLRHDRRWMLVDEDGVFLTQRKLYRMALVDTAFIDGGLRVVMEGKGSIDISFDAMGPSREVQVWDSLVAAVDVGFGEWFTEALGHRCSLVYMPDTSNRPAGNPEPPAGEIVSFADSNPILVAGVESIQDLNERLDRPVPIRRFRANVVLRNIEEAFDEDEWTFIEIGDVRLRKTKRCGRCVVTTIDIETGNPSDEPLRTLATYRRTGNNVFFGTYFVPEELGDISVGDVAIVK